MKFIYKESEEKDLHWIHCEKYNAPFIEVSRINNEFMNIFYDITNYKVDLDHISKEVKDIYISYTKFFMLSNPIINNSYDQYYFFNLAVKCEHTKFIAEQLHDYLLREICLK